MRTEGRTLTSSRDAAVARDGEKRTSQASRFSKVRAVTAGGAQGQANEGGHRGKGQARRARLSGACPVHRGHRHRD